METKETKNKMITLKISEREREEIKTLAKSQGRPVANFILWLVAEFKRKSGVQ
jgi:uncharacterized protein (DUF1778 family)